MLGLGQNKAWNTKRGDEREDCKLFSSGRHLVTKRKMESKIVACTKMNSLR